MDHPIRLDRVELAVRPWRTATVLIAAVAAIELVLLVIVGGALLAKPEPAGRRAAPKAKAAASAVPRSEAAMQGTRHEGGPGRAAAAQGAGRRAQRQRPPGRRRRGGRTRHRKGYRIGLVGNAPSHDYPRSLVMYRRGFEGEAQRLARDLGVKVVSPLDGMRPAQLHGAHAVFILGG